MKRISKNKYYLDIAQAVSKRSTCLKRKYGCVIVKNDEIIATGYNGSARNESNCCDIHKDCPRYDKPHNSGDYSDCPAVHAEQNAMLSASRQEMIDSIMYLYCEEIMQDKVKVVKAEPCPICKRMIKNVGISKVINLAGEIKCL